MANLDLIRQVFQITPHTVCQNTQTFQSIWNLHQKHQCAFRWIFPNTYGFELSERRLFFPAVIKIWIPIFDKKFNAKSFILNIVLKLGKVRTLMFWLFILARRIPPARPYSGVRWVWFFHRSSSEDGLLAQWKTINRLHDVILHFALVTGPPLVAKTASCF